MLVRYSSCVSRQVRAGSSGAANSTSVDVVVEDVGAVPDVGRALSFELDAPELDVAGDTPFGATPFGDTVEPPEMAPELSDGTVPDDCPGVHSEALPGAAPQATWPKPNNAAANEARVEEHLSWGLEITC